MLGKSLRLAFLAAVGVVAEGPFIFPTDQDVGFAVSDPITIRWNANSSATATRIWAYQIRNDEESYASELLCEFKEDQGLCHWTPEPLDGLPIGRGNQFHVDIEYGDPTEVYWHAGPFFLKDAVKTTTTTENRSPATSSDSSTKTLSAEAFSSTTSSTTPSVTSISSAVRGSAVQGSSTSGPTSSPDEESKNANANASDGDNHDHTSKVVLGVGLGIGIPFLIILAAIAWFFFHHRRRPKAATEETFVPSVPKISTQDQSSVSSFSTPFTPAPPTPPPPPTPQAELPGSPMVDHYSRYSFQPAPGELPGDPPKAQLA